MEGGRHRRIPATFQERRVPARERTRDVLSTPGSQGRPDCEPRKAPDDLGRWLWNRANNCLPTRARL